MWDVKLFITSSKNTSGISFISTMWDVKYWNDLTGDSEVMSFISTMWDVKGRGTQVLLCGGQVLSRLCGM